MKILDSPAPTIALLSIGVVATAAGASQKPGVRAGYDKTTVIEDSTPPENSKTVIQAGQIVESATGKGVEGAIVSAGPYNAITDPEGVYGLALPAGYPFLMRVKVPGYSDFIDAETILTESINRHRVTLLSDTEAQLTYRVIGRDPSLGVLVVNIQSLGDCMTDIKGERVTNAQGATIHVNAPGDLSNVQTRYFWNGLASAHAKSARSGETPVHAIVYNLPVNVGIDVEVSHPSCASVALPVQWRGVTYTATPIHTEPGNSLAYTRVWLR